MNELENFLSQNTIAAQEIDTWGDIRLEVRTYLTDQLPPLDWVTSVRAIVRYAEDILTVRDPGRIHILPGGRREANESLEQTLRREILEETGWHVAQPRLLGVKNYHHLNPKPLNYAYPYPDFLQIIYVVYACRYEPGAKEVNGYELSAMFIPLHEVQLLPLTPSEHLLLSKAVA